jgi:hypothetical protein
MGQPGFNVAFADFVNVGIVYRQRPTCVRLAPKQG